MDAHIAELETVSKPLGLTWLGVGFHPFATVDELPRVPKLRYPVMEQYLPTRGARGLDMMKRTCTVQANMDFESEADAMRKLRVSLRLQPIITAMFSNSPWHEGQHRGRLGERADVWLNMDPERTGLLPFAWTEGATYQDYVTWALQAPMFLVLREGRVVHNTGQRFAEFLADGYEGTRATLLDWETHLNTLFPEVRLKRTLEIRRRPTSRCRKARYARGWSRIELVRRLAHREAAGTQVEPSSSKPRARVDALIARRHHHVRTIARTCGHDFAGGAPIDDAEARG
jgi:glutamate--cysteine ligase